MCLTGISKDTIPCKMPFEEDLTVHSASRYLHQRRHVILRFSALHLICLSFQNKKPCLALARRPGQQCCRMQGQAWGCARDKGVGDADGLQQGAELHGADG